MRINNNIPPISIGGSDPGKRTDRPDSAGNSRTDKIQLSSVAQSAAAAQTDKLENLRLRVASGTYRPSADEVADSIIDEMLH